MAVNNPDGDAGTGAEVRQNHPTKPAKPTKPTHSDTGNSTLTVEEWAHEVLSGLGIKPTGATTSMLVSWAAAEGGHWNNTAHYNPLNTTEDAPGASSMNDVGVKAYTSWQEGIQATIKTLTNGYYGNIISALKGGNKEQFAQAVVSSKWGTHHIDVGGNYASYGQGEGQTGSYDSPSSVGGGGGVGNAHLSKSQVNAGLDQMGFASALINSNKSLRQAFDEIINKQIDVTSSAGQARATQILQNTAWFQNHTASQRAFDDLQYADPASYQQKIKQQTDSLRGEANSMGLNITPADLATIALTSLRNGLTSDEVSATLAHHFTYNPTSTQGYKGTAGSAIDNITQQASAYYAQISPQQIQKYVRQVLAGTLDPSSLSDRFKDQAISMYPYLKSQLDSGQTVADVANPYQQMMANTLELNPDDIKQNDPLILGALQSKDQNGQLGLKTLSDFQQQLYSDPRWLNTRNAKQSLVSTTGQILQKMGLIT